MTKLPEKLRLKAMAEEDIYFAKKDREMIAAMHRRRLAKHLALEKKKAKKKAKALEKEYTAVTVTHWKRLNRLAKYYRALIKKARTLVTRG